MYVQDIMHSPVIRINRETCLSDAYELMQNQSIRHLPVVSDERLVGIVTDRDLRLATSALHPHPFPREARVERIMNSPVITASPRDPVEEAARLMFERKIGCLPVLDGESLIGIVAGTDLLDAVIRLTGVWKPGSRMVVRLGDDPDRIASLVDVVAASGAPINSLLSYGEDPSHDRVILRVGRVDVHPLAHQLREQGFEVLWPPETPWSL